MDTKKILKEQKRYYQFLYSSQNPQVNGPKFDVFFDNDKIKTLNDEQRKNCEGLLTENDCLNALKCFQKNKSPGNDGFTAEFYSFFGTEMYDNTGFLLYPQIWRKLRIPKWIDYIFTTATSTKES